MENNNIVSRLEFYRTEIPSWVKLIAVVKGQPVKKIQAAWAAGQVDLGENYAQEMLGHVGAAPQINWHFIGHLQRNKVKQILPHVILIHTVDSLRLAEEINKQAESLNKVQEILVEINLGEETKSGLPESEAITLIEALNSHKNLLLKGLMGMPPVSSDPEQARPYFRRLREIGDAINKQMVYKLPLTELSMGMTQDYRVAIEEGSTMVRIGTGIFGERKTKV